MKKYRVENFNEEYKEFTLFMVAFMKEHPEYWPVLEDRKKKKKKHVDFVSDLFMIWLKDKSKLNWYLNNALIQYEEQSL